MRHLLILLAISATLLFYTLTRATDNNHQLTEYYWWIVASCAFLIMIMFGLVWRYIRLLKRDSQHNMLGSKLARRLAMMFTLVAVVPALALFAVSAQFISSSINSWFGNDTAQALDSSMNLSKSALNLSLDNIVRRALPLQDEITEEKASQQAVAATLAMSAREKGFDQLVLYDVDNNRVLSAYNPVPLPLPSANTETATLLAQVGSVRGIENINGKLFAQGWLKIGNQQQRFAVFFREAVPENVARDAELIENARSKYAELSYAKQGLETFFLITLLVAAGLAVMLALVVALYFARRFLEPILSLAEGAKAVAQGDFSQHRPVYRNDELGNLTHLFNHMTEQLGIAQLAEERNRRQQEAARHYLETIVNSISAGVVTIDRTGRLKTHNQSAEIILGSELKQLIHTNWHDWLQAKGETRQILLGELFQSILATDNGKTIQTAYSGEDEARILLAKATPLADDNDNDIILVFDDITALVRAQKEAAWGEVAQRLAHEIRNPLTPIQLSAERLAWKLENKLSESDAQILTRSTDTIIKQVAAMKEMVEAFRNYARAPSLKLEITDFNALIAEVLLLYESNTCTFDADLSNIPLLLKADSGAMRQVLHNIFKNAAEAAENDALPQVHIHAQQHHNEIILTVCNNGKSFSTEMLLHAFDPYVTDKPTGTGLGLPVVKKIIEEHGGRIHLSNLPEDSGACVKIILPTAENHEK